MALFYNKDHIKVCIKLKLLARNSLGYWWVQWQYWLKR